MPPKRSVVAAAAAAPTPVAEHSAWDTLPMNNAPPPAAAPEEAPAVAAEPVRPARPVKRPKRTQQAPVVAAVTAAAADSTHMELAEAADAPLPPPPPPTPDVPPEAVAPPPAPRPRARRIQAPIEAAAAAVISAVGADDHPDIGGDDLRRFGDLSVQLDALRASIHRVDTTTAAAAAVAAADAHPPRADPVVIWDALRQREADGTLGAGAFATWGALRQAPWAKRFDACLRRLVSDTAPAVFPFMTNANFVRVFSDALDALPIVPAAPLAPFFRLITSDAALRLPRKRTVASMLHEYTGGTGGAVCLYEPMGLTSALCASAFGCAIDPETGARAMCSWTHPHALALYEQYMGVHHGTVAPATTPATTTTTTTTTTTDEWCRRELTDAAWSDRTARVCAALHRLAVALTASDGADPMVVPLATVAAASEAARDAVVLSVRKARDASRAAVEAATRDDGVTSGASRAIPELASAWNRARIEGHISALVARANQTDGVSAIEDVATEVHKVQEIRARIMPLMTAIRGRALVSFAQAHLSLVTDDLHDNLRRMTKGSLAIATLIRDCLTAQWDSMDGATSRSTLLVRSADGADAAGVQRASEASTRPPKHAAILSAALSELATCHPLALASEEEPIDTALREGMKPTRFEREMLAQLWEAFDRIAEAMLVCLSACVFTRADATLLDSAGNDIPVDLFVKEEEEDAAGQAPQRARAQYTALVRACVDRCRGAREVANAAARPSPPPAPQHALSSQ